MCPSFRVNLANIIYASRMTLTAFPIWLEVRDRTFTLFLCGDLTSGISERIMLPHRSYRLLLWFE